MKQEPKIAIITGAGSGIGRAVAIAMQKEGWTVVLAGRTKNPLEETAAMITNGPGKIIITDVTDASSVARLFRETVAAFGRLDLLFNNAGVSGPPKPFEQLTLKDWNRVIATNLTGSFLCAKEAFAIMKDQSPRGGRIINNGSISAYVPRPQSAPYSTSKHGITGLTRSVSLDGRAYDICCGQIDIGNAKSTMSDKMAQGIMQADGSLKKEPVIAVEEVARAVVYMASQPLDVNIPFMTVMANGMPYMGRG